MADIPVSVMDDYGDVSYLASSPAGDAILWNGQTILVEFRNGHSSAITITFAPEIQSVRVRGVGLVNVPSRVYTIQPGADAVFIFEKSFSSAYVDETTRLPISYTGGNANLKVRAIGIISEKSGLPAGYTWTTFEGQQIYYAPVNLLDENSATIPAGSLFVLSGSPVPRGSGRVADDGFNMYSF